MSGNYPPGCTQNDIDVAAGADDEDEFREEEVENFLLIRDAMAEHPDEPLPTNLTTFLVNWIESHSNVVELHRVLWNLRENRDSLQEPEDVQSVHRRGERP